jgi:hypothetical protein
LDFDIASVIEKLEVADFSRGCENQRSKRFDGGAEI